MKIYQSEINAGLSEIISSKSSVVYASQVEKSSEISKHLEQQKISDIKALAGIDDSDLYYTQSILVSTSWNKNDDIFDPREVWMAKDTPTHKPTNLEHNETMIVGHITANWPIDENGQIIEETVDYDTLPEKFHILTGSVIYKGFTEPELKERAQKLIAEIENGTKYVSMECFFKGFDYGLIDKSTGQYHTLARNEQTAFLTKHLRAYGGQGEHQNYKIGRVLRDITFSGKGFVDKPANPESIIFSKSDFIIDPEPMTIDSLIEKKDNSANIGVFSIQANLKETTMSVETQAAEIETTPEATTEATTVVETPVANTEIVAELEALKLQHEEAAKKMAKDMEDKEEAMKKMKAELISAQETIAAYKSKEMEMMKQSKNMKRMAALLQQGVDSELASATVDKFENIDDDAFESMTSLIAGKMPDWLAKKEKDKTKEKASEVTPEESVLETAEVTEDVSLSVGSDNDESELNTTRAALVEFVCNRLGTKLNKGE